MRTIFDQIKLHATFAPSKPAMILTDRVITYEMLHKGVLSVQSVLRDLALDRESPIGIVVDNPARHLIVLLALLKSGFTFASLRQNQVETASGHSFRQFIIDGAVPVQPGRTTFWLDEKWFARTPTGGEIHEVRYESRRIVQVRFSSGSTGAPKSFGRTFDVFQQRVLDKYFTGIASGPRFLTLSGFSGSALDYVLRTLMDGNSVFMCPHELAASTIFGFSISEVRASALQARGLLEQQRALGYDINIGLISTGSAALPVELADDLQRTFRCNIINTYSSTEAGTMALAAGAVLRQRAKKGNCFAPLKKIEIVNERAEPVAAGAEGLIRVKSDVRARPFTGEMSEPARFEDDGWFYPGDVGRLDEDGLLIVSGRADEVINDGGLKYSPELIEDVIKRHPAIADAAVVRMTLANGVAEPWIAVVARTPLSLDVLHEWMMSNIKTEIALTRFARLVPVRQIPMTASGKIARQTLREQMAADG